MRYLLEELTAYEDGFSDILMEDREPERHETFMGMQDPLATPTKNDIDSLGKNIIERFGGLFHTYATNPLAHPRAISMQPGMSQ